MTKQGVALLAVIVAGVILNPNYTSAMDRPVQPMNSPGFHEEDSSAKPRIVVTTDPELDDSNSMVRFLLYSNEFETVGLVYASSEFHWSGDLKGTKFSYPNREHSDGGPGGCPCTSYRWPTSQLHIDRAIDAYAKVFSNLRIHDPEFPTPDRLRAITRWGNVEFEGDISRDTAGSDLIRDLLLDDNQSPVYLLAWGGESTIARALKSIDEKYRYSVQWPAVRAKVIDKAIIVPSGHQDDTYASYIKPVWPEIRYLESTGGVPLGYGAQSQVSERDATFFSAKWMKDNVLTRGPMGEMYRVWGDGLQMVPGDKTDYFGMAHKTAEELTRDGYRVWAPLQEAGSFIGEGDTPTFLNFVDNGLNGFREESFGGWAGHRMTDADKAREAKLIEAFRQNPASITNLPRRPDDPFVAAVQRDFAARLQWTMTSNFREANHRPVVSLKPHDVINARRGEKVPLVATVTDADDNQVTLRWWHWNEEDGFSTKKAIKRNRNGQLLFKVPSDAKPGQSFQVVAEASDDGQPALTGYGKLVIRISN